VGTLEDGSRVYFGFAAKPWGTMSERTVAPRVPCSIPLPDGIDDVKAAAIANPGMSAWLSLKERAGGGRRETVLVLGGRAWRAPGDPGGAAARGRTSDRGGAERGVNPRRPVARML